MSERLAFFIEKNSPAERKWIFGLTAAAFFLTLLDQITKILVENSFRMHESKVIINNFFSLTFITNKGAAWGIFEGRGYLLLAIALVTMILCVIFFRKITEGYLERYVAMGLLFSGIIGNSIDRIWRGEVVDFLDFYLRFGNKVYHWPAFNVADICICAGVGIFMLSSLLRPEQK